MIDDKTVRLVKQKIYQANRVRNLKKQGLCERCGKLPVAYRVYRNNKIKKLTLCLPCLASKKNAFLTYKEALTFARPPLPKVKLIQSPSQKVKAELLLAQEIISNKTTNASMLARRLNRKFEITLRTTSNV